MRNYIINKMTLELETRKELSTLKKESKRPQGRKPIRELKGLFMKPSMSLFCRSCFCLDAFWLFNVSQAPPRWARASTYSYCKPKGTSPL